MNTATNNSANVSGLDAGSTVTHQDAKQQTFALKVQFNDDIRRFNLSELSWEPLVKRVAETFNLPEAKIVLKYQDEEGDLVTVTNADDLFEAQRVAAQRSAMLRLFASKKARNEKPSPDASRSADFKEQKKALKEERKLLKEEKKQLYKQEKEDLKRLKREAKLRIKHEAAACKAGEQPPAEHKRWRDMTREEKIAHRLAKHGASQADKEGGEPGKCKWRDMTKEERMALREARRSHCKQEGLPEGKCWKDLTKEERIAFRLAKREERMQGKLAGLPEGKCWKDLTKEERIAIRQARREARMQEGGGCRNKVIGRFVKHVSIPDGTQFEPCQAFVKTWRMRNEGQEAWNDCKLVFVSRKNGDLMGAAEEVPITSPVLPGSEVDVSVNMVAPEQPGRYVGFWRLAASDGRKFGQRIWVKIDVVCSSSSSEDEKGAMPVPSAAQTHYEKLEDEIAESFVEIKDEAPVVASPSSTKAKPTIAELLKQLKALGFEDVGKNIPLLKKHNGDINKVIAELIQ